MITRILFISALAFTSSLSAAELSTEDLLRQGLFEEEANRDFEKAAERYRAVVAAHDRQRSLAATATFRLGEIARKTNDKEAAAATFRTVVERFPEQEDLVRMSRENLNALGMNPAAKAPATPAITDPEDVEIASLQKISLNNPDLLDGAGTDGWRPLHHAAAKGWTRVVSYLLENQAASDSRTLNEQLTPLQLASIHGYLGAVKTLLAAKADVNLTFNIERCPKNVLPVAPQQAKDAKGNWTALDLAILYDRREVARSLIEAKTDLKRAGPVILGYKEQLTSLALAIYFQRNALAQTLIEAGAPLGTADAKNPITPLGIAVGSNLEMVVPLLKAGADPKQPFTSTGWTPLQNVAAQKRIEIAKILLEAGADVNAKDSDGYTALHWAGSPEMVDLLISKGADIHSKNKSGLTPLEFYAENFDEESHPVIASLFKHHPTVEDPIALLRRTNETNLTSVRELIVYPRLRRPDAIHLSVSGRHSFNLPPPSEPDLGRPVIRSSNSQDRPDFITLETRTSSDSPPPSLAEALCEAYSDNQWLQSIRILRHTSNDKLEVICEWKQNEGATLPEDWPAIQWGDIIEVRADTSGSRDGQALSIAKLSTLIPARSVTLRLGDLEIPYPISGDGRYWLRSDSKEFFERFIPNLKDLADFSRFVIRRKGVKEPISLDFTQPTEIRFRLLDGDTVEISWNLPELDRRFGKTDENFIVSTFGGNASFGFSGQNLLSSFLLFSGPPFINYRQIYILRRTENWKSEILDLRAWLDALPPSAQWKQETLQSNAPKLYPGDVMILIEDPAKDDGNTAIKIREKLGQIDGVMRLGRQLRPRVNPPPTPSR